MIRRHLLIVSALTLILTACSGSKVSTVPILVRAGGPVKTIAMAPGGGLLADSVAIELSNRGYTVIDQEDTSRMMVRLNLNELEVSKPEGLTKIHDQGVDAMLSVRAAAGYDGLPMSASARVVSTDTGKIISGVTWQNGWGGMAGSIADRTMRQGMAEAAKQITDSLAQSLPLN